MADLIKVNSEVFTVSGLFTDQECDEWIAHGEALGHEAATVNSERGPQRIPDLRNNARVIFDDQDLAGELWQRIASVVPNVVMGFLVALALAGMFPEIFQLLWRFYAQT